MRSSRSSASPDCESPFFTDRREANALAADGSRCAAERDWPELLAVLGASIPTSVAGAALFTTGAVSLRLNRHISAVADAIEPRDAAS